MFPPEFLAAFIVTYLAGKSTGIGYELPNVWPQYMQPLNPPPLQCGLICPHEKQK